MFERIIKVLHALQKKSARTSRCLWQFSRVRLPSHMLCQSRHQRTVLVLIFSNCSLPDHPEKIVAGPHPLMPGLFQLKVSPRSNPATATLCSQCGLVPSHKQR